MSRSFNKKSFDTIIKIVYTFLKWSIGALYVLLSILLIGAITTAFLPIDLFDFDLSKLAEIDIRVMNIAYELSNSSFVGQVNVKWLVVLLLTVLSGNVFFYQFIQIQLKKVMGNVKAKNPFSTNNVVYLKIMGFAFLISSVILPLLNGWLFMSAVNKFNIFEATINFSINFQSVFMGALILILAYIFDYGSYLQEEHDMTV